MISIYPLSRQCAVCRSLVNVGEDHRGKLPSFEHLNEGVDGRPGYEDSDWLAYHYYVEECSQCGHLAPNLSVPYPAVMHAREARAGILALEGHAKNALRFMVAASLFGDADPRAEGWWLLRAAWIDEGKGFPDGARGLRRRAAKALDGALREGYALVATRLQSSIILAECTRIGGEWDRALEHCARGARFSKTADLELRKQLMFEAHCALEKRSEPLTRSAAIGGFDALTPVARERIIDACRNIDLPPIVLRPRREFTHALIPRSGQVDEARIFALDFMDADLMVVLLREGRGGVWAAVVDRPKLLPALLRATDHEEEVVRMNALRAMYDQHWPFDKSVLEGQADAVAALAKRLLDGDAMAVRIAGASAKQLIHVDGSWKTVLIDAAKTALPKWKRDLSVEGVLERLIELGVTRIAIAPHDRRARTMAEAHFAVSLRRCPTCGAQPKDLVVGGAGNLRTFDGACPFCGTRHAFAISLKDDVDTCTCDPGELGDDKPSAVISAPEFARELVRLYDVGTSDARWRALTCVVELLKHAAAGVTDLGEGLTKEWLIAERDRLRPISPASREIPKSVLAMKEPPKTVKELFEVLELPALDAERTRANGLGRIKEAFKGTVTELTGGYSFHIFSAPGPIDVFESLGARELTEWVAKLAVPGSVLDAAFEKSHGKPRLLTAHRQYGAFFIGGAPNDATCTLAWYQKTPDWAVPVPPFAIRERALRDIEKVVSSGGSLADVVIPEGAGVVVKKKDATGLELELVPPMLANDVISVFGWGPCIADCEDMHMQRWYVQQHTGENQFGAERRLPAFGSRGVKARFDHRPSGGLVRAGGLGTYAIGPEDVIRFLSIAIHA